MGTSGFSYPAWRGAFYPPELGSAHFLAYYSNRLAAVEVNQSFYTFPRPELLEGWAQQTPAGFRFCLKAHRSLTYSRPEREVGQAAWDFGRAVGSLGERAGPVLLQLPPGRSFRPGLLESLLTSLDRPAAVEVRHPSWLQEEAQPEVGETIRRHAGALVVTDAERWPRAPILQLSSFAYFRLRREYDEAALGIWARTVRALLRSHEVVHVFFGHGPKGPERALRLIELVG